MFEAAARLATDGGFHADGRFRPLAPTPHPLREPEPEVQADPVAEAFAEGYAQGLEHARAEAARQAAEDAAGRDGLKLAFARLDGAQEEELRLRLRDTVAALCESALAPFALDPDMLARRVAKAAAMFARADDERVIRLHPADIAALDPGFAAQWAIHADASLERGSVRVESRAGGVEDGPATWRRAIAEALDQC